MIKADVILQSVLSEDPVLLGILGSNRVFVRGQEIADQIPCVTHFLMVDTLRETRDQVESRYQIDIFAAMDNATVADVCAERILDILDMQSIIVNGVKAKCFCETIRSGEDIAHKIVETRVYTQRD